MKVSLIAIGLSVVAASACSKKPEPTSNAASSASVTSHSIALPSAAAAASMAPFEGEITLAVTGGMATKLPTTLTYDVKGTKVRYSPASPNVHLIDDQAQQHAYTIDDDKKTYEDLDLKPAANAKPAAEPTLQKKNQKEKIAGMDCDDETIDTSTSKVDACVIENVAFFDLQRDAKAGTTEPAWAGAMTKAKVFPLRLVVSDASGKEQYRMLATKIDRKAIDDAVFAVPSGLKKSDLSTDEKAIALP